jgi:hypothetical protein
MRLAPVIPWLFNTVAQTYDGLKACAVTSLMLYAPQIPDLVDAKSNPSAIRFDIVIAGISETSGPDASLFCSHDLYAPPWMIHDVAGNSDRSEFNRIALLPSTLEMYPDIRAVLNGRTVDDLDPVEDGIRVAEIQRAKWIISGGTTKPGGFLQLATVTTDGMSTRIIHRWADEVASTEPQPAYSGPVPRVAALAKQIHGKR